MSEPFIAQITMFGGNFAPRGWAFCHGQLLPIAQNTALFSLLGTTYGGDGRTTFALPDLRGRVPMQQGTGPGLSTRQLGQKGGTEYVTLDSSQMPQHHHPNVGTIQCVSSAGNSDSPSDNFLSSSSEGDQTYSKGPADSIMNSNAINVEIGNYGGGQPHTNVQPFLCINYIIALQGVYPSRN